ncbi:MULTISPECIES: NEL-type E3 ubiquitin ligase domain-containing protein [unclassified Pseudomonas]|uniref:NEL-type E3 ubiquitin ligase domain-containing protein n=1 Tax=unclassified Pseudomonas TaxID=196821 RepID=UPI001B32AFF9|nr:MULTISPECIES: NEL-type E3 ubiquitin ligase domain-containing protein [unclassified Pseudomonas]MBP5945367.1 hypothetical protein [Pseudomonas sp. P9(2020)]MBZ9563759.1 hypothetical protein [Pseudomonas sp. P116]
MLTTQNQANPQPPTSNEVLGVLLESTGDLDSAEALQKSLPDILLKSSAATLVALDQTARDLHAAQLAVDKELSKLQPLHTFCKSQLIKALNSRWTAVFDVEKDLLSLPGAECGCPPSATDKEGIQTFPHATQTLLQAAMQNFSKDEETNDYPVGSLVRVGSAPAGVAGLTPASFAKFCRELDLGKRYQEHFQEVFGLSDAAGKVVATSPVTRDIATMKKHLLHLDMHLAGLRQHITPAGSQMMQRLIAADGVVSAKTLHYRKRPWIMQGIEVLDSCIWGVVVFSQRSFELYPDEKCVVYMAAEPQRPLYEYQSFTAFKQYLAQSLRTQSYKDYLANSIDEDDKADFFKALKKTVDLGHIKQLSITVPLFEFMVQSHLGKLQIDACKLAVPTAEIDEDVRRKRLLDFIELGVTVATVAGFFVPVVGQLMMGVAVGQILGEVYEGYEDWQRGDQQEALSHLLSVAENIALMGVFAAGQKVVGALGRKLVRAHPEFFSEFTAILNSAGKSRLWKPDLTAYEHRLPPGFTVADDSVQLYQVRDKSVGCVDHRIFSGTYDATARRWHLEHPARTQAYTPRLDQHVEGGWRLPAEDAEEWNSAPYTLKRIDPGLCEFGDKDLDVIRRLGGATHDELNRTYNDNLALSARLRDTVQRMRIERQLDKLIRELASGETHAAQPLPEQLQGLPKLPGWPTDRYLKITDAKGGITATYPANAVSNETLSVLVSQQQLEEGRLLQKVIDGLSPKEVETLLGAKVSAGNQRQALARKLGATFNADRRGVFERMYQRYDQSDADEVKKLRQVFADIPARYAQRLIDQAPSIERVHLRSTGRVPLRLGQKVQRAIAAVRVDRALSGFHVPQIANADNQKLAIQLLPRLSGWDARLRLTVRDKTLTGPVLEAIGDEAATPLHTCTLVKSGEGYEAFAGDGQSLGRVAPGPDSLYAAILKALPTRQRSAVGFPNPVDADSARLRGKLLDVALDNRETCTQVLADGKLDPRVNEPVCMQANPPATASLHPLALLRKVRKLYPLLSEVQASEFIDDLGADPLTRAIRVKTLRRNLEQLRDVLEAWDGDDAAIKALGGDVREVQQSRTMMAEQIEDSFRRLFMEKNESGRLVCTLNLDGLQGGKLPTLPPGLNFDHIEHLSLKNMAQGDDLAYFLKSFKQVVSLELDGNQLTRMPEVLSQMPMLTHLSLARNRIKLTEQTLSKLGNLRTLRTLILDKNPLGATLKVEKLADLRTLCLNDTHATELPLGLQRLPHLDWVDLRNNEIKDLPDWLFKTGKRFSRALNLRGNPLSLVSQTHLADYRNNVGIGMGYLENDIARMDEYQARSLWFTDKAGQEWERRNRIWTAFKDDQRADGLFHLLSELGDTADSERVKEDMHRRVWRVLEAAEPDAQLSAQVMDVAASPINCTDTAAMNFSDVEIVVEVSRAADNPERLLELGRGLFRLAQLDEIAQAHIKKNPGVDPLEVGLAYRTGLVNELSLPNQPQHMRYAALAGVTTADLAAAKTAVITAELTPQLQAFVMQQAFWRDHLKRSQRQKFASIDATYPPRMNELYEKASSLSSADYRNQMEAIQLEQEQAEDAVIKQLTDEAMRRVDLGICAMTDV